jgi:hypothetical protein
MKPDREILFTFDLFYYGTTYSCSLERRYLTNEIYHIVLFDGIEYPMRLMDDMFRFIDIYMYATLRTYEDYLTYRIFSLDM